MDAGAGDRFIPNRSLVNFDYAHYMLVDSCREKVNNTMLFEHQVIYRKRLAEILGINRTRILAFSDKPPVPKENMDLWKSKPRRYIPKSPLKKLDAVELLDDYSSNLLGWGSSNVLAIALNNSVYLCDPTDWSSSEVMSVNEEKGPICSISWAPDGLHLAVGLKNSPVELWDCNACKKVKTLQDSLQSRVGSLDWNQHILTTGGMDGLVINNDVRLRTPIVQIYKGHSREVCGLKWSSSGQQLATGGNDNLLHIWDRSMASLSSSTRWLHRFKDYSACIRAVAWCPYQRNVLAAGGGEGDNCVKFWDTQKGLCLNSIDTGTAVCSLLWNNGERELLSSNGSNEELTLWRYPSMMKISEFSYHGSRVLYTAQSPDGNQVASAAGEILCFWDCFASREVIKPAANTGSH